MFQTKGVLAGGVMRGTGGACGLVLKLGTPDAIYFFAHDLVSLLASSRILSGKLQLV
jgi:hypothetical protein